MQPIGIQRVKYLKTKIMVCHLIPSTLNIITTVVKMEMTT